MNFRNVISSSVFLIMMVISLSCSDSPGGPHDYGNLAVPGSADDEFAISDEMLTGPDEPDISAQGGENHYLLGYFHVYFTPGDSGVYQTEIVPVRNADIHFNALKWMEEAPCTNCFQLTGIENPGDGTLNVDITLTHPLAHKNFTAFDMRGIIMWNNSMHFPEVDCTVPDSSQGDGELLNADGYTGLYNITTVGQGPEFQTYIQGKIEGIPPTASVNGYIRHTTDDPSNTRNAIFAADSTTQTYHVALPTSGGFVFGYAVDLNWDMPTTIPVIDPMTDFPMSANCPDPWKIEVLDTPVGIGLTDTGDDYDEVTITVYDYEGYNTYDDPELECPGLFNGLLSAPYFSDGPGYEVFKAQVYNELNAVAGEYKCLVWVEDHSSDIPVFMDIDAYHVVTLTVNEFVDLPPVAVAQADPNPQTVCEDIHFFDDGSYDQDDGGIVDWWWDWDNDGTFDEQGSDLNHSFDATGTHYVNYRDEDDDGTYGYLAEPMEITIGNALPTAVAQADKNEASIMEAIEFDGTGSFDNDCSGEVITNWEWDWDNDGIYDLSTPSTQKYFDSPGIYYVQLRVTDDEGGTDTLDNPLEITITESTWVNTIGGSGGDTAFDTATDSQGNVYFVGRAGSWNIDFDPGPGTTSDMQTGCCIAKYDTNGQYLWAHTFYSANTYNQFKAVAVDGLDHVYAVGRFAQTVDFDPGDGVHNHTVDGYSDAILLKLDSSGNYLWSRSWGGTLIETVEGLSVTDTLIYVAGDFEGTADFDPFDGGEFRSASGDSDCFLSCINLSGVLQWVNTWGGVESLQMHSDRAYAVTADDYGNVVTTGRFAGTCDFDPDSGVQNRTADGDQDCYVVSYSSAGNYQWVNTISSDPSSNYEAGYGIAADDDGYVYAAGRFGNTVDFDPSPNNEFKTSNGNFDVFLVKYDWNGVLEWVETIGAANSDQAFDVAVSDSGFVSLTGIFNDTVDFDPGPGHMEYTSNGAEDSYVTVYDTSGAWQWANGWGGDDEEGDWAFGVDFDQDGNVFVSGYFSGTCDFDPDPIETEFRLSAGGEDFYLIKFLDDGTW